MLFQKFLKGNTLGPENIALLMSVTLIILMQFAPHM